MIKLKFFFIISTLLPVTLSLAIANTLLPSSQSKGEQHNKLARKEYPTDTLYELWQLSKQDPNALIIYFTNLKQQHIVEPIQHDDKNVLITYFAIGSDDTDYILQSGGPDFYGLRFKKIGHSNLYFCSQKVPNDAIFNYGFNRFKLSIKNNLEGVPESSVEWVLQYVAALDW